MMSHVIPGYKGHTYLQHGDEFRLGNGQPFSVHTVHHINDGICVGIVTPPVRPRGQSVKLGWCHGHRLSSPYAGLAS